MWWQRIWKRSWFRKVAAATCRGLDLRDADANEWDPLVHEQPWLAGLYAASVSGRIADGPNAGRPVTLGGDRIYPETLDASYSPRCASIAGFSLHANVSIPAGDRDRLERLFRYAARQPLATERLEQLPDGRLMYRFKRMWRNGATHALFSPLDLIERLAALVPTPRAHLTRYHGIIGPAAKWRPRIVPAVAVGVQPAASDSEGREAAGESADTISRKKESPPSASRQRRNYAWAELIRRVFSADVLSCSQCGGKLRLISAILPPETTRKILDWVGLPSRPPPVSPARINSQSTLASDWL